MPLIGLDLPRKEIDGVFDSWDIYDVETLSSTLSTSFIELQRDVEPVAAAHLPSYEAPKEPTKEAKTADKAKLINFGTSNYARATVSISCRCWAMRLACRVCSLRSTRQSWMLPC